MSARCSLALISLVSCAVATLGSCGGDEAAAAKKDGGSSQAQPAAAAKSQPPSVDPQARYNGKTLDEYTPGLEDLNPAERKRAMQNVLQFGSNAFPLKERMQRMAVEDSDDELRAGAVVALYQMEDPDADAFLLERLRDPSAMQTPRGWQMLLQVVVKEIDADALATEAANLAGADPAHAENLFGLSGGSGYDGLHIALARSLLAEEHSDASVANLMRLLPRLDLSSSEEVAYITANYKRVPDVSYALNALRAVGEEEAFAATLTLLEETQPPLQTRTQAITSFPPTNVAGSSKLDAIAAYFAGATEPEVQQIFAALQQVSTGYEDEPTATRYQAVLTEAAAPTNTDLNVRGLAILFLCEGVASGKLGPEGLDPAFTALESAPEEILLGTAIQELQKLVARAPEPALAGLPERLARTMYARDPADSWAGAVAQGMLDCFRAGLLRMGGKACMEAIAAEVDAHPGSAVNFQVLQWMIPMGTQLMKTDADMAQVGGLAGRLMVDASMGPAQADWIYNNANMSVFNNTSVASIETIMAYYEPILMTEELADHNYFKTLHATAINTLYHIRGTPDGETFLAFAQRIANEAPPTVRVTAIYNINNTQYYSFRPAERKGATHFDHELGGKPARIKPMVFHQQRVQTLNPAHFLDGQPGEAFLMSRIHESDPPSLGLIAELSPPLSIAFLDADGRVIAVGRTDDAALQTGKGQHLSLTHARAQHAILFREGEFDLPVDTETGIDPAFLAAL